MGTGCAPVLDLARRKPDRRSRDGASAGLSMKGETRGREGEAPLGASGRGEESEWGGRGWKPGRGSGDGGGCWGQDLGHDWHRGCGGERALRQWTRCGLAIVLRRRMHVDWGRRHCPCGPPRQWDPTPSPTLSPTLSSPRASFMSPL
jgi:hypothetical protein